MDDLLLCASVSTTQWIEKLLTERFGTLTKQTLPFAHTGLQLEMVNHECLRLHQDDFNSKLKTHDWTKDGRKYQAEEQCTPEEATSFRSITCACLWGCQTRPEELSSVISLQTKLKTPQIKDLIAINVIVKRLRKPSSKTGIFFWRLRCPLHAMAITDASGANKKSDHAVEGISLLISEDKLKRFEPDQLDYLPETATKQLGGKCHLMLASSTKSKRVSHSKH